MSCLASANIEVRTYTAEEQDKVQSPKPVLVSRRRQDSADCVMRRVAAVVDGKLANGSMPA